MTNVASDKCSVKKMFLVVDRAVKVTCFFLKYNCSFLKYNLRHMLLVLFFLVKNNSQGTENTKPHYQEMSSVLSKF